MVNHAPIHLKMANITYVLLPTQALVVDPTPGYMRVEFSPEEIRQAVEAREKE